jgi:secondary thiamine-phosphate synthase enzyme
MKLVNKALHLKSEGHSHVIDITERVGGYLEKEEMSEGMIHIFIPGATAAITTIEYEQGLIQDAKDAWERIAPRYGFYRHDRERNDDNSHSHIRASLIGPSLTVPFKDKKMILGRWQRVVFIDFDTRCRERELIVQIIGEEK